jgi:hypothetical protein
MGQNIVYFPGVFRCPEHRNGVRIKQFKKAAQNPERTEKKMSENEKR